MTAQEQALARDEALRWLREQMGEGWECLIETAATGGYVAAARSNNDRVDVDAYGPDPMSAARACVKAWREANPSAMRDRAERAALDLHTQLRAEQQHADRLAEALRKCPAGYSGAARQWYAKVVEPALAAHDARRGKA